MSKRKLEVNGTIISIDSINETDYVNLTEIAKQHAKRDANKKLYSWFKKYSTLEYLEAYETVYNPNFDKTKMIFFKDKAMKNRSNLSFKDYIQATGAIGIQSKAGRFGGTWAVVDIATDFLQWLNPYFKVLFTRDYWRMKTLELQNQNSIDEKTQQFLLKKASENTLEAHQMVNDLIKMIEERNRLK